MTVRKELPDNGGHHRSEQPESGFDHEAVFDRAAVFFGRGQRPFVMPTTLQPRTGFLHEANAFVDACKCESVTIERHEPEQQEPTLEDHASVHFGGECVVIWRAGHSNERVQFVVHAGHRRDAVPNGALCRVDR